jgi:hypothetical protein
VSAGPGDGRGFATTGGVVAYILRLLGDDGDAPA